jgi:hypothetical protein
MLREEVTAAILARQGEKSAFRYAACGLADVLVKDARGVHVAPMGCGHRLCPRCGRTKGRPMIKKIFGWLAAKPHGDILSMVLTQRVQAGESVSDARARLVAKEMEYIRWLQDLGMVSAASCAHVVWSEHSHGWHYHVHLLIEMPRGWRCPDGRAMSPLLLRAMWRLLCWGTSVQARAKSSRLVCAAGDPDRSLADGSSDPDFWTEQKSGLAVMVQYPVRDIAQGISAKRMGGDRVQVAACVAALLDEAKGWKLRRCYGQWRKPAPKLDAVEKPVEPTAEPAAKPACPAKPICYGTVHRCARMAAKGDGLLRSAFDALEVSLRNNTDFAKRCLAFCRMASGRGIT